MTAGYYNACGFTQVILDDNRNPDTSWANHLRRGSAGGVDLVAAMGTPVYAPADCVTSNTPNNGTGGNTVTMSFSDGWRDQYMHLSRFVAPGPKSRGQIVGYSGNSGGNYAPHIHWHRIDPQGRRQNPFHYFAASSSTGGTSITPLINIPSDVQKKFQQYLTNIGLYSGLVDGAWGPMSWTAIQTFLAREKVYAGAADGIPGKFTVEGLQQIAARGGYTGPIDGDIGPKGVAGLDAWLNSVLAGAPAPGGEYGLPIPGSLQKLMQEFLTKKGLYTGLIDGDWGKLSWIAIQTLMNQTLVNGAPAYSGPADGDPGANTYDGLQRLATLGGYTGPIDHDLGDKSLAGLAAFVNIELGKLGPATPPPTTTPASPGGIPVVPNGYFFGVDVGSSQSAFDFTKFKAAGGGFTLIKMGGANTSDSPYVAPEYRNQLARARAAKIPVGHYWFNGQKITVEQQAAYFSANANIASGDIVAIDVEAETKTGTRAFTPEEVLVFTREVRKTYPGIKFLIYMSASVVRSGDWSKVRDEGHELWVAAYNANDGTIGSPPNIDDWSDYMVWQYSSIVKVPGWDLGVDANLAKIDLFAKLGWSGTVVVPDPTPQPESSPLGLLIQQLELLIEQFRPDI